MNTQARADVRQTLIAAVAPRRMLFSRQAVCDTAICKHCGRTFQIGSHPRSYCGQCGDPQKLARLYYRMKVMKNPALHEKKLAQHRKWREWAKAFDPEYRRRKAESQWIWRMKQSGVWMR